MFRNQSGPLSAKELLLILLIAVALGAFTTSEYVKERGVGYIADHGTQMKRLQDVLDGVAMDPWQYRVLSAYLVSGTIQLSKYLHLPHPVAASFICFRIVQDVIVLLLAFAYFRRLGLGSAYAIVGMITLAWGMGNSHFDSDFSFNTFFDVSFYLLAGLCVIQGRWIWVVPITLFAALNRETSGLIPFLLLSKSSFPVNKGSLRRTMPVFVISCAVYLVVFFGLRAYYGGRPLFLPYGHQPGFDLLRYNLCRVITWQRLIATLGVIPLIAVLGFRDWPVQLRTFFWVIVPIWFAIHTFGSVMAETRLLLVPQAMVFIPGALFFLAARGGIEMTGQGPSTGMSSKSDIVRANQ